MNIPLEVGWSIVIGVVCYILGTLRNLEGKVNEKVSYKFCDKRRSECPCLDDNDVINQRVSELEKRITTLELKGLK